MTYVRILLFSIISLGLRILVVVVVGGVVDGGAGVVSIVGGGVLFLLLLLPLTRKVFNLMAAVILLCY